MKEIDYRLCPLCGKRLTYVDYANSYYCAPCRQEFSFNKSHNLCRVCFSPLIHYASYCGICSNSDCAGYSIKKDSKSQLYFLEYRGYSHGYSLIGIPSLTPTSFVSIMKNNDSTISCSPVSKVPLKFSLFKDLFITKFINTLFWRLYNANFPSS